MIYEEEVQRGGRLKILKASETWKDLDEMMKNLVIETEDLLLAYKATDVEIIKALHRKAINTRDFYNRFNESINGFINAFEQHYESKGEV